MKFVSPEDENKMKKDQGTRGWTNRVFKPRSISDSIKTSNKDATLSKIMLPNISHGTVLGR